MPELTPAARSSRRFSLRTALPFGVFLFFLAAWTYELLTENPVPDSIKSRIPVEWRFWMAKGLHVVGYAFLTLLARLLPIPRFYFWLVILFLLLHGIATEIGQRFVAGRTGSLRDVLLDWCGVLLGLLLVGLMRMAKRPPGH